MFIVNDMPPAVDGSLLALLEGVEPATVGHFRHSGFLDPELRAVIEDCGIVAGTAVTVRAPGADSTITHYAMGKARAGDFLVVDRCGDHRHAAWGGATAAAARVIGLAGAVIDGRGCDFAEIRESGVPVWCRGPTPVTTKPLGLEGALNVPVTCGGVTVHPGDVVLADASGIVIVHPRDVAEVAERALAMQREEREGLIPRLEAGERLPDISGATRIVEKNRGG